MSEIPSPPLTDGQKAQIRLHPLPAGILLEMRNDMAERNSVAGSQSAAKEVISGILAVGLREGERHGTNKEQSMVQVGRENESQDADAVRDFVRTILLFLSKTDAAASLEFKVYLPALPSPPGQSEKQPMEVKKIGTGEGKEEETLSFADALQLVIPLWPNVRPPPTSQSANHAPQIASENVRKKAHVLPLTVEVFYQIMGHEQPLGHENDIEIWQAVQNLLHLFLSPSTTELSNYQKFQQKAIEEFIKLKNNLQTYAKEHPYKFAGRVALGVVGMFPALILGPALGLAGFGAAGVAQGSTAAALQATLYAGRIPAGSIFSLCQSYAMGGSVGAILGTGVSAVATGLSGVLSFTAKKNDRPNPPNEKPESSGNGTELESACSKNL